MLCNSGLGISCVWFIFDEVLAAEACSGRCSPRGFSATCLQQMQGLMVEGLSQTGLQCILSETLSWALCFKTIHNTGISLLLSINTWVLF